MAPKPLADLIEPCIGRAVAAQGFSGFDLIASWPEIVGERLAAVSQPIAVVWPRRRPGTADMREPASLTVRVVGAFALELQHLAPVLIERVNTVYGWRCIGRLVLKQAPLRHLPPRREAPVPTADQSRRVDAAVAPVATDGLRDALRRLGSAVLAEAEPGVGVGAPASSLAIDRAPS